MFGALFIGPHPTATRAESPSAPISVARSLRDLPDAVKDIYKFKEGDLISIILILFSIKGGVLGVVSHRRRLTYGSPWTFPFKGRAPKVLSP